MQVLRSDHWPHNPFRWTRSMPLARWSSAFSSLLLRGFFFCFNPPALALMTLGQKIIRIVCLCMLILVGCVLAALASAVVLFVVEYTALSAHAHPQFAAGLGIIAAGLLVNALCVKILLIMSRMDSRSF